MVDDAVPAAAVFAHALRVGDAVETLPHFVSRANPAAPPFLLGWKLTLISHSQQSRLTLGSYKAGLVSIGARLCRCRCMWTVVWVRGAGGTEHGGDEKETGISPHTVLAEERGQYHVPNQERAETVRGSLGERRSGW